MEDLVSQAKAEYVRAKERIARGLASTPDDRIHWSPSDTARTPVQQVAHAAMATAMFGGILAGRPHHFKGVLEEEHAMRAAEREFTTREQVLDLLERNSAEYLAWMDTITSEQLGSTVETPFGPMPMTVGITLLADHLRGHAAQIDYIQTIYGDLDWHVTL